MEKKSGCCYFYGINADSFTITTESLIGDHAVDLGEKSIITAKSDVGAGMNLGPKLTNQNVAGPDNLAAKSFYPAPLAGTIPTIP
jgi:hypothetical protein